MADEMKTEELRIRMTPDMQEELARVAQEAGLGVSTLARVVLKQFIDGDKSLMIAPAREPAKSD